jgi:hypothetical protein
MADLNVIGIAVNLYRACASLRFVFCGQYCQLSSLVLLTTPWGRSTHAYNVNDTLVCVVRVSGFRFILAFLLCMLFSLLPDSTHDNFTCVGVHENRPLKTDMLFVILYIRKIYEWATFGTFTDEYSINR